MDIKEIKKYAVAIEKAGRRIGDLGGFINLLEDDLNPTLKITVKIDHYPPSVGPWCSTEKIDFLINKHPIYEQARKAIIDILNIYIEKNRERIDLLESGIKEAVNDEQN